MILHYREVLRDFFGSADILIAMRARFGDCVFDSGVRELRRGGRPVALQPKAMRFLEVLLERRPQALSKEQLHALLWPDCFVSESSLQRLAAEVRSAIGDDARAPRFLRTAYGFGYAFCGAVRDEAVPARPGLSRFRLVLGDREIHLLEGENILGRTEGAAVWIDSSKVSRRHARIVVQGGRATLEDLGSKNGTFLRGKRLAAPKPLADGDEIVIGAVLMTVRAGGSRSTDTDTAARGRDRRL